MKTIIQDIKSGQIRQFYLLYGSEDYLKHQYRDKLLCALANPEDQMNVNRFDGGALQIQELIALAETLPFFAEHRVILAENSTLFKKTPEKLEQQLETLPASTHIIFVENEVDKRNRLYKWISKHGYACQLDTPDEKTLFSWIRELCRTEGKEMDDAAMLYLVEHMGTDMLLLRNELEKLFCYRADDAQITQDDIRTVCVSQASDKIFAMMDAIGEQRQQYALQLYRDLLALKEAPMGILRLMLRHFNLLMQVQELSREGKPNREIASICAIPPFAVKKYASQAGKYTFEKLRNMVEQCQTTEEQIKSGTIRDTVGVELLIAQFSG